MSNLPARTAFIAEPCSPDERSQIAALPNSERQQRFANMLVRHDGFDPIIQFLELVHMPIPGGMPNVGRMSAVYAPYRSGKSTALRCYQSRFPDLLDGTTVKRPVLYFHCHGNMNYNDMLREMLAQVTGLVAPAKSSALLLPKLIDQIEKRGVELLILDDLYNMVSPTRRENQRKINNFLIKILEAQICHVTVAGPRELDSVLRVDGQVEGRGGLINPKIPDYDWHDEGSRRRFRIMLDKIDDHLPMKIKSGLGTTLLAAHFYDLYGGSIGFILDLIFYAMALAMRDNANQITPEHLSKAASLQRAPSETYTPFIDELPIELVGRRKMRGADERRGIERGGAMPFEGNV